MAWVTPKTNWTEDDYFNASDYNRIRDNVLALYGLMPSSAWSDDFDIADMGSEKLVNDLLYAREFNTVLDNLELIGSHIGLPFDDRPYYSADGSMPDADELNLIEEYELLLYNRINGITE